MRGPGRLRKADSLAPDRRPQPPTQSDTASACHSINSYLSSKQLPFSVKPKPSGKDMTEILKFLLSRLGFSDSPQQKTEDEVNQLLQFLKSPFKFNKDALRAPSPRNWPNSLAVIHWLVQIVKFEEFNYNSSPFFENDKMFMYNLDSYNCYIKGDDDGMLAVDEECKAEMRGWKDRVEEDVLATEENVKLLEGKLEGLRSMPSAKEAAERQQVVLEKDVSKFHMMIEQLDGHLVDVQRKLEEKEKGLDAKVEYRKRICVEKEELKKRIEEQGINSRDAERMKRELQAVERDIEETEASRNGWEEKIWELDSGIGQKSKELELLVMKCNQSIRRFPLLFLNLAKTLLHKLLPYIHMYWIVVCSLGRGMFTNDLKTFKLLHMLEFPLYH